MEEELLTDTEVAEKLRISVRTLRKHAEPDSRKGVDIRKIKHFNVGGNRRWSKKSLEEFIC